MLKSILPVVALALCTPLFAGNKLVSDPFRAVHQSWKTHPVAGRDFWLLLSPQWLNLKGLENETFIRESGTGFVPFHSSGRNIMPMRVLSLESVKCFDASGKELATSEGTKMPLRQTFRNLPAGEELSFVKEGSSLAYIKKGHRLTVEMLVEAMLLPSGNDAAYVLAAAVGHALQEDLPNEAEAVAVFIQGANAYAKEIGLCGTVLTVPDGYAEEEHYTTTEDMAILARHALENETIRKYASMHKDFVTYASGHTNTWENTNLLLNPQSKYYSPYATGLKTGSIQGEYSLVFSFRLDDGREYIVGLFGANQKNARFRDANLIISFFEKNL